MGRLQNRTALITGAARGIGRGIALAFAKEGARVALTARTAAELNEVVAAIRAAGGEAYVLTADLAAPGEPPRVAREAAAALGHVEILVNNAGIGSSAGPSP